MEGIHYKIFVNNNNTKKKILYLTYIGFYKAILTTYSLETQPFVESVINQMARYHFALPYCQLEMATEMVMIEPEILKDYDKNIMSCIYLFKIGSVKQLRTGMKLDKKYKNTDIIYKWGKTTNLKNRTENHLRTYGKFKGSEFELAYSIPVDKHFITRAENDVKFLFEKLGYDLEYTNHKELAIVPHTAFNSITQEYDNILNKYIAIQKEYTKTIIKQERKRLKKSRLIFETEYNKRMSKLVNQAAEL